ncbi:vWA domain-containing protein [Mycobacterium sp. C31M]
MTLQPALPMWLLATAAVVVLVAALARSRDRNWLLIAAAVLLLGALLRPVIGGTDPTITRVAGDQEPNVFLLVDRSADMTGPRMAQARNDIGTLIDRYPDARFALIGFADRPSLDWPLSADTWSLRPVIDATEPYRDRPDDLANAGAAGNILRYQLIGAMQQFPRARNLVFYLGAGTPEAAAPIREFELPPDSVDGGAVLGYGDLGEPTLRAVADQIGVSYVSRAGASPLDDASTAGTGESAEVAATPAASGVELYWLFGAAAAILVLVGVYRGLRDIRRNRLDRVAVGR